MVAGLLGRDREILTQVTAGLDEAGSLAGVTEPNTEEALKILGTLVETLLAGLLSGLSSATVLIVGIVTGLFILLFLMKDWQLVTGATSDRIAAMLGVPLALPIAIVTFVTSYIPFLGAFFAGAFAVLIALGAQGVSVAVAMLVTTAGTLLFGVLGATLAAPVTAVTLRTIDLLREAGLFAQEPAASGRSRASA